MMFIKSKYPKKTLFDFENKSTVYFANDTLHKARVGLCKGNSVRFRHGLDFIARIAGKSVLCRAAMPVVLDRFKPLVVM